MTDERTICAVCAWRKDCLKKFSFDTSGPVKCADYCRDLTLPAEEAEGETGRAR